ncbi:hypothetical protein K1719_034931 [Acacia pycnantha]|nr:hypothetical protein K1719_034931 [Acacia pycnantha]
MFAFLKKVLNAFIYVIDPQPFVKHKEDLKSREKLERSGSSGEGVARFWDICDHAPINKCTVFRQRSS